MDRVCLEILGSNMNLAFLELGSLGGQDWLFHLEFHGVGFVLTHLGVLVWVGFPCPTQQVQGDLARVERSTLGQRRGQAGTPMVQVLQPLQVEGNAGC